MTTDAKQKIIHRTKIVHDVLKPLNGLSVDESIDVLIHAKSVIKQQSTFNLTQEQSIVIIKELEEKLSNV